MSQRSEAEVSERLARNVAEMREKAGLSQPELGRRAGLSASMISKIESGIRGVSQSSMVRVARALGVDMADLLADKAPDPAPPRAPIATVHYKHGERLFPDLVKRLEDAVAQFNVEHYARLDGGQ